MEKSLKILPYFDVSSSTLASAFCLRRLAKINALILETSEKQIEMTFIPLFGRLPGSYVALRLVPSPVLPIVRDHNVDS